jgi:hypothetical protein
MVRAMRTYAALFVGMTVLLPTSGHGELPEFGPPPADASFDDVDDAVKQTDLTRHALAFLETLHRHWGEGPERLRTVLAGSVEREEENSLVYLRNVHDHGVLEGYEFRKGSLARGRYLLIQGPVNGLNEFIGYYTGLKETLTKLYGEPAVDQVVWSNDLYYHLPDYWGVAVMIGHLRYQAAWETAEGTLTLDLSGHQFSRLSLEYRVRGEVADT